MAIIFASVHSYTSNQSFFLPSSSFFTSFDKLFQNDCCPNAELRCSVRIYTVADRDYSVEIIKIY